MNKNQKGFSILELLLIILLIGLVVGVGWYVWMNRINDTEVSDTSQINSETSTVINPLPAGSDLAELAKTQDQKDIATSILEYCISLGWDGVDATDGRVAVSSDIFNKSYLYSASSTNANVSASCYSNKFPNNPESQPTGREYLLHKDKTLNKWIVDSAGQDDPLCSKVDNLGYTTEIVPRCGDGNTLQAPKP